MFSKFLNFFLAFPSNINKLIDSHHSGMNTSKGSIFGKDAISKFQTTTRISLTFVFAIRPLEAIPYAISGRSTFEPYQLWKHAQWLIVLQIESGTIVQHLISGIRARNIRDQERA